MVTEKTIVTNNWSIEWDGKPMLDFLMTKAKCSYGHALEVIKNEGGYVDENGIIRVGTATNKVATID